MSLILVVPGCPERYSLWFLDNRSSSSKNHTLIGEQKANITPRSARGHVLSSAATVLRAQIESTLAKRIPGALTVRPAIEPEAISIGIPALDRRSVGIPRGCLSEICGPASSGRTTLLLSLMREVTEQGECCALIDASNAFDPLSASANGVNLARLFCARCAAPHPKLSPVDKSLKATDMILSAGGFGLVVLDLGDIEPRLVQKIPLSYWYRFRRAVELTAATFIVLEQQPSAKSCASLVITLQRNSSEWVPTRGQPQNPKLLTGANFAADVTRSRIAASQGKPPQTATEFRVATSWAG